MTGDQLVPAIATNSEESGLAPVITDAGPRFADEPSGVSIDPGTLYGIPAGWEVRWRKITRRDALAVAAVKGARDLIANAVGGLNMGLHDPEGHVVDWSFLDQPEDGIVGKITWTRIAEDLLFDGLAWLAVTHVGWHNKPVQAVRLDPASVSAHPDWVLHHGDTGTGVAQQWKPDTRLIRFESPNGGLLEHGARAIRTLVALSDATDQAANALPPLAYFAPADGTMADPDPEAVLDLLDDWEEARANSRTAYVPLSLQLKTLGWNPDELQLPELRREAVLEIARLTRVDAEELAAAVTSRTYFNAFDRMQQRVLFTFKPYLDAISGRLSMDDVTPRGYKVRHDLSDYFATDALSRYQAYEVGKRVGAITGDEIRDAEGKPPLTPEEQAIERALPDATERTTKETRA